MPVHWRSLFLVLFIPTPQCPNSRSVLLNYTQLLLKQITQILPHTYTEIIKPPLGGAAVAFNECLSRWPDWFPVIVCYYWLLFMASYFRILKFQHLNKLTKTIKDNMIVNSNKMDHGRHTHSFVFILLLLNNNVCWQRCHLNYQISLFLR